MKIYIGNSLNPYFNLATEEYFLKHKKEDIFMLWRNDKSVIIGKNQNSYAEINFKYITENNIKVVRRMTGGGAVYHDLGNVNYTYIKRNSRESFNNYGEFCRIIISYLKTLGVNAYLSGRNDMLIDEKKFSGNAQCAYGNSVMHHGTLLFSTVKDVLSKALNVNPLKIESKGIKSVRSRVTNISDYLKDDYSVIDFILGLKSYLMNFFEDSNEYFLNDEDLLHINKLVKNKYSLDEWNYGFKHDFTIKNERKFEFGLVQVNINIVSNKISDIKIYGDFFGSKDISGLECCLKDRVYDYNNLKEILSLCCIDDYIKGMDSKSFLELIFI